MFLLATRALATVAGCMLVFWVDPMPALGTDLTTTPASSPASQSSNGSSSYLDLSSAQPQISASGSVTIKVGTTTAAVQRGELLTPAEALAVQQVMNGGTQSLILSAAGAAIGGQFTLAGGTALQQLVIPKGVALLANASSSSTFSVSGSFVNNGSFFAYSTDRAATLAVIEAGNIFNNRGAILSSILPSQFGIPGAIADLNLTLFAANQLVNAGTLSSAANLNLVSGSGKVVNNGTILSTNGSVNVSATGDLLIDNRGGTIAAPVGTFRVRDPAFDQKAHLTVWGGNIAALQTNLYSGKGIVTVNVEDLSGTINIAAHEAHVATTTGTMSLGRIELGGDPTFYNANGNVVIGGDLIFHGQALAIVARGDILSTPGGWRIDTSSTTANGGAITMIAGADFLTTGFSSELPPGPGDKTSVLTINGGTAAGGKIDLRTNPIGSLTSKSTATNRSGGDIVLVAYGSNPGPGSDPLAGTISLPSNLTIFSGGKGTGKNGSVRIAADGDLSALFVGDPSPGVDIGSVDTRGGTGGGGSILIGNAGTIFSAPVSATIKNGVLTYSGNLFGGWITATGSVHATDLLSQAGQITVNSYNDLSLNSVRSDGVGNQSGGSILILAGQLNVDSNTAVPGIHGLISANAGTGKGDAGSINLDGGIKVTDFSLIQVIAGAQGGNGGTIALGGGVELGDGTLQANGSPSGGSGGRISISGTDVTLSNTSFIANAAGSGAFNGGTINIFSYSPMTVTGAVQVSANATGTGNGGIVSFEGGERAFGGLQFGFGAGRIAVSATGGSPGSSAGNGGSFTSTRIDVTVEDSAAINIAPIGNNGSGGTFSITSDNTNIQGDINVSGKGIGNGGTISISGPPFDFSSGNTIEIGAGAGCIHCVSGRLIADAGAVSGNGGTISVTTGENPVAIIINNWSDLSARASGTGNGGSIILHTVVPNEVSDRTVLAPGGVIDVSAAGGNGNGGTVILSGLEMGFSGNLQIKADASGTGHGGKIAVETYSATPLMVGAGSGQLSLSAQGGSPGSASGAGGEIILYSRSAIEIDPAYLQFGPRGTNGSGGTLQFFTSEDVTVSGGTAIPLSANGVGSGNGGTLNVVAANAGLLKFQANAGAVSGNGGTVIIGRVEPDALVISDFSNISALPSPSGGNGGNIIFAALQIELPGGTLSVDGTGNGNGGSINFQESIYIQGSNQVVVSAPVILSARGSGSGSGGAVVFDDISFINTGQLSIILDGGTTGSGGSATFSRPSFFGPPTNSLQFGNGSGQIQLSAKGGAGGSGGQLTAYAANIVLDPAAVNLSPGQNGSGGSFDLTAFSGLLVTGSLDVSGNGTGSGGSIYLQKVFIDGTDFTIGTVPSPTGLGVEGSLKADGSSAGSIEIRAGAISIADGNSISLVATGAAGSGGTLSLLSETTTVYADSLAVNGSGTGSGGTISIQGQLVAAHPNGLTVSANGGTRGNGGTINWKVFSQDITLGDGAGSVNLDARGGQTSGNGGTVKIETSESITVEQGGIDVSVPSTGSGGNITLIGSKGVFLNSDLSADGQGARKTGGTISLQIPFAQYDGVPYTIAHNISVSNNSSGGIGGSFTLGAADQFQPAPSELNVQITGDLVAAGSRGLGSLNFNGINGLKIDSSGQLVGKINATGTYVNINNTLPGSTVSLGTVISTNGPIDVSADTPGSKIQIVKGGLVQANGNITLSAPTIINNGIVTSSLPGGTITYQSGYQLRVGGSGTTYFTGGGTTNILFNSGIGQPIIFGSLKFDSTLGGRFTGNEATLVGIGRLDRLTSFRDFDATSGTGPSSTILGTDTLPRSIPTVSEDDNGTFVASGGPVLITGAYAMTDAVEVIDEDTEISRDEEEHETVYLHRGKMLLDAGRTAAHVRTPQGTVTVDTNSTALVSVRRNGVLSTTVLNGSAQCAPSDSEVKSKVDLKSGQELLVASEGLEDEDLIPVDGSDDATVIEAYLGKSVQKMVLRKVNRDQIVAKSIFINGSLLTLRSTPKKAERVEKNLQITSDQHLKGIAFVSPAPGPQLLMDGPVLVSLPGTQYEKKGDGELLLSSGGVLLLPAGQLKVRTAMCSVYMDAKTCAEIQVREDLVRIKVLSGVNGLKIMGAQQALALSAGQELVISKTAVTDREITKDGLARRRISPCKAGERYFGFSEFSIPDFLRKSAYNRHLLGATDKRMRKLSDNLHKTAVALQIVGAKHGAYHKAP